MSKDTYYDLSFSYFRDFIEQNNPAKNILYLASIIDSDKLRKSIIHFRDIFKRDVVSKISSYHLCIVLNRGKEKVRKWFLMCWFHPLFSSSKWNIDAF